MVQCPKVNKKLLPMKVVMFGWFGATACSIPYMTVHMKELGITVEETAIIYTLLPITQFLASPVAGFIADKLGKYRDVLLLSVILTVVFGTALLFVPPAPTRTLQTSIVCAPSLTPYFAVERCRDDRCADISSNTSMLLSVQTCKIICSGIEKGQIAQNENSDICFGDVCHASNISQTNRTVEVMVASPNRLETSCAYPILEVAVENATYLASSIRHSFAIEDNCTLTCSADIYRDIDSKFTCSPSWRSRALTVWVYSILRIVYNIFSCIGYTLVDSSAIAMAAAEGDHYGRQRFWAILATAIFSPVSGLLVDVVSEVRGYLDYSPAFYAYNVLALATAVAVWRLEVSVTLPENHMIKNLCYLIRLPAILFLLLVIFWLGTMWGFLESFLFWFLTDLGSSNCLLGLTVTIGSLVGLPFLHHSQWFVRRIGHVNLLTLALIVYLVRCVGYSLISEPWWFMPFEAMEIFTYHLMWVAAATYSAQLTPPGLLATIQGCVGGLHYGIGQGSGSLIGGVLMSFFGARQAFQILGGISGALGVFYGLLYFAWLRKSHKNLDSGEEEKKHRLKGNSGKENSKEEKIKNGEATSLHILPNNNSDEKL